MASRKPLKTMQEEPNLIKAPYQKLVLTDHQQQEFLKCALDPVYFTRKYVWIQHPKKGKVPFHLFDYQEQMIRTFAQHRQVISMCARQLGKCVSGDTQITKEDSTVKIEDLIKLSLRQRIVNYLEKILLKLSRM